MAYIPDKLGERRRADGVSQTAYEFFVTYCEHAARESGLTFANVKTCSEAFSIRRDNAQKYDCELVDKGWIRLVEKDGRIYRKVQAGWIPSSERKRQGKAENTTESEFLNFRKLFETLLNSSESSYVLENSPKFKEILLNLRKAYKEVLNQHSDQPTNQLTDQTNTNPPAAGANSANETDSALPKLCEEKPTQLQKRKEPATELPADFCITDEMRRWAIERGLTINLDDELEEFTNFWCHIAVRNKKRTAKGWLATWQGRMRDVQEKRGVKKHNGIIQNYQPKSSDAGSRNAERIENTDAVINELLRQGAAEQNLSGERDVIS